MASRLFQKVSRQIRLELAQLARAIHSLCKAPSAWAFLVVWAGALVGLATAWHWDYVWLAIAGLLWIAICAGITLRITELPPPETEPTSRSDALPAIQVLIVGAIIVITGHSNLVAHGALRPAWGTIHLWSALLERSREVTTALRLPSLGYIVNPLTYFLIPAGLLVALGARPRELGLRRSHRWLRVTLIWSMCGIASAMYGLSTGSLGINTLIEALLRNAMQNGFFEEFLFRGALLTRCRKVFGQGWALTISSLAFGVWHTGAAFSMAGGKSLVMGMCLAVAVHSLGGLAFGLILIRTRSLLAPSIVHVLLNLV